MTATVPQKSSMFFKEAKGLVKKFRSPQQSIHSHTCQRQLEKPAMQACKYDTSCKWMKD